MYILIIRLTGISFGHVELQRGPECSGPLTWAQDPVFETFG